MDSRNVSDDIEVPSRELIIPTIFAHQADLITKYHKIEKMPPLPLNLNSAKHQVWIKDFLWRVTEELAEAEEEKIENGYSDLFFEELSDALHFLVEIPILLGYGSECILSDTFESVEKYFTLALELEEKKIVVAPEFKFWDIVYFMGLMGNTLKNKKWKQTQILTDDVKFKYYLHRSFLAMFDLFIMLGLDLPEIYVMYFKKHKINKFRQDTKY